MRMIREIEMEMTLDEFESEFDVTSSTMSRVERGWLMPTVETIRKIANAFGKTMQEVVELIEKAISEKGAYESTGHKG